MRSIFLKNFFYYSIFSLAVLLAFLLIFEQYLALPALVNWLGHWHPLVLHFPIVLILVTIVQYWRKDAHISIYIAVTTFFTLISAITGLLLSLDGGSKGDLILTHQWLGVSVAYLMSVWYWLSQHVFPKSVNIFIQLGLIILIVVTGHFGGMVTHGRDFLAFTKEATSEQIAIPDDPIVFEHIVLPILENKCVSCHNSNKSKGEFVLSDFSSLMAGGKSGLAININDLTESELLKRLLLPIEDEKHMPPADEDQLSESELAALTNWIEMGAQENLKFSELELSNPLYPIIKEKIKKNQANKWSMLPDVSDEEILELSSDYCHILRMQNNSNALQVLVFPHKTYSPKILEQLKPLAKNIIELDVHDLPLGNQELTAISNFSNLEKLNLSGTPINDELFTNMKPLQKLSFLKVYNTKLGASSVDHFVLFPALAQLYVYNTNMNDRDIETLKEKRADLQVIGFSKEALEFKSVLPAPTIEPLNYFFRKPFYAHFKHPLSEIDINYTTDGTTPDSNSTKASDSIYVKDNFTIKYIASKPGWESSSEDSVQFLKSSGEPINYELKFSADQKYLGVGKSLLFDLEKGSTDFGDDAWMAFRDNRFILNCEFENGATFSTVILSSIVHTNQYIFPPISIEIRGGDTLQQMKLLGSLKPDQPAERQNRHFKYYECKINSQPLKFIQIIVEPLRKLPNWHRGKGEGAWFFVDEVVFQE